MRLWAVLIMLGLSGCIVSAPMLARPTDVPRPTPQQEDANDWPKDCCKNPVVILEAHLDEIPDNEFGHTTARYFVFETGYSMNERAIYNWAFQNMNYHRLKTDEMVKLWALIKGLPNEPVNVPRDKRLIVEYQDGKQWIHRVYRWDVLPQGFDGIYELLGGERYETRDSRKAN
jgi:hypothetical protein